MSESMSGECWHMKKRLVCSRQAFWLGRGGCSRTMREIFYHEYCEVTFKRPFPTPSRTRFRDSEMFRETVRIKSLLNCRNSVSMAGIYLEWLLLTSGTSVSGLHPSIIRLRFSRVLFSMSIFESVPEMLFSTVEACVRIVLRFWVSYGRLSGLFVKSRLETTYCA